MSFPKQIIREMANTLKSKFILITGVIVLLLSVLSPIMTALSPEDDYGNGGIMPMYEYEYASMDMGYSGSGESVTIDGVTVTAENPFYYEIVDMQQQLENGFDYMTTQIAKDYATEVMQLFLDHYLSFAQYITTYEDYRYELMWRSTTVVEDLYLLQADVPEANLDAFVEGISVRIYRDPEVLSSDYLELDATAKAEKLAETQALYDRYIDVVQTNNFSEYCDLMIESSAAQISEIEARIETLEKTIIENPAEEEYLSMEIEWAQQEIDYINEITIPIWQLRKDMQIEPYSDDWQNTAISRYEQALGSKNSTEIMDEEEFMEEPAYIQEYGSYAAYVEMMNARIAEYDLAIQKAENSLAANTPDMEYVPAGARNAVNSNLSYSVIVAFFGVLIGGFSIASEFQTGTIRLLMIRPRSRTKVLMSKYIAGLKIVYITYLAGMILNIIANGLVLGFEDYANPNFTGSGEIAFFGMMIERILVCSVTVVFGYTFAFMLSTLVKNMAVSIAIPGVFLVGSTLLLSMFGYSVMGSKWIAYTPVPYVNLYDFYPSVNQYGWDDSMITELNRYGNMNLEITTGVIMLLALTVVGVVLSLFAFKKQDIAN